jgi:hypothetical protein
VEFSFNVREMEIERKRLTQRRCPLVRRNYLVPASKHNHEEAHFYFHNLGFQIIPENIAIIETSEIERESVTAIWRANFCEYKLGKMIAVARNMLAIFTTVAYNYGCISGVAQRKFNRLKINSHRRNDHCA